MRADQACAACDDDLTRICPAVHMAEGILTFRRASSLRVAIPGRDVGRISTESDRVIAVPIRIVCMIVL